MKDVLHPPYTVLAEIYDAVMKNVDYQIWSEFIDEIIQQHHPKPHSILELACGTGSLSLALNRFNDYHILGTDKSEAMLQKARRKAKKKNASVAFKQMDFLENNLAETFDIIVSIFDSINYLHTKSEIQRLLSETKKVMNRQSLFIFDFTTPKNSMQAIYHLNNEEGTTANNYHFLRKSRYDENQQIHYNSFQIEKLAADHQRVPERSFEEHRQRAYSLKQMQEIIAETDFRILAQYGEYDLEEATSSSLRITMVLQCLNTP